MPVITNSPYFIPPVNPFLLQDTFTDTNGTTLPSHTPDVGGPWVDAGVDGFTGAGSEIQNNKCVFTSDSKGAVVDVGVADVDITVKWTTAVDINRNSVILRYQDTNNYIYLNIREENGDITLWKREGGVPTSLDTAAFAWAEGVQYTIRAVANGTSLTGYINGTPMVSAVSSFNQTLTKFGLMRNSGSLATTFDDLEIIAA